MEDAWKRLVNSQPFKCVTLRELVNSQNFKCVAISEVLKLLLAVTRRIYYGGIDLFSYFTSY